MPYETFPDADAVTAVLTNAGQTVGSIDIATPLAAVIAGWGTMTGWNPFLLASSSTRYFDAPRDGYVELPGYGAITAVAIGVTYDQTTGAPSAGTAQVANVGYFPIRWRDGDVATPIVALDMCMGGYRIGFPCARGHKSIAITGTLGWPSIPDDVYSAILEEAAARVYVSTNAARAGGVLKVTIGGRSVELDPKGPGAAWSAGFTATARRYMRAVVA